MNPTDIKFELEDDDEYDKFCGKVFLTTKKNVIFHCVLCESKYLGFESFLKHLEDKHFADTLIDDCDELDGDDADELPLDEDEFPIATLQKKTSINLHFKEDPTDQIKGDSFEQLEHTESATVEIESLNIVEEKTKATLIEDRSRRTPITPNPKGIFSCPHCPLRFTLQFTLRQHLKDHETDRIYKCDICGVQFKKIVTLRSHLRRHDVEKKWKCNECNRSFITPSELRYHQRKHNGEKPYQCESCGVSYAYNSNLRLHRKRHHTHQKDYPCPLCPKSYYTPRHLRDHMSKHTNEASYKCDKCGREFKQSSTYQRHKAQHRMQEEAEKDNSNCTITTTKLI